jgi:hypothetical protein
MIKGYLRISQCSPKDGMISNRVRHLFIFLAWLYPLSPDCCWGCSPSRASVEILFPKQGICWGFSRAYFLLSRAFVGLLPIRVLVEVFTSPPFSRAVILSSSAVVIFCEGLVFGG